MYNRRYDKVFLMLRQETAGYAVGKRPPWGSCIMELKNGTGRLMLTVQGLRPLRYAVYLLAGQESIFCGELHPEKKEGHAELKWAFNPDAVGEGKRAEDFHTVLILAEEGGCSAPLAAYFGEKTDWKAILRPQKGAERQKKAELQEMPKLQEKIDLKAEETTALSEQKAESPRHRRSRCRRKAVTAAFRDFWRNFDGNWKILRKRACFRQRKRRISARQGKRKIPLSRRVDSVRTQGRKEWTKLRK